MSASVDPLAAIKELIPQATERASLDHPAINVPAEVVLDALRQLRDRAGYDFLVDLTAIDQGEGVTDRFTVVYHLFSTAASAYVRVATDCRGGAAPVAPSVTALWPAADWHEREAFDMFGIRFEGHPDLRRILMWDGYPHHPLRKEFPLAGVETQLPDLEVAAETGTKVLPAPMVGGPFVASSGEMNLTEAEPRAKDESWNERHVKPE
jgi:NADH-quinone oxidoreductase subunit C